MKLDFTQKIKNLDGQVITQEKGEQKKELTLKDICVDALLSNFESDRVDGNEKLDRYNLAVKIKLAHDSGELIELTVVEIEKIKKLVGLGYGTMVVGQVFIMLDAGTKPE